MDLKHEWSLLAGWRKGGRNKCFSPQREHTEKKKIGASTSGVISFRIPGTATAATLDDQENTGTHWAPLLVISGQLL